MEKLLDVASYIVSRYSKEYGSYIDEMKLHKLLYFAQRESFIINGEALFNDCFHGWKFGPVMPSIRMVYKTKTFPEVTYLLEEKLTPLGNIIFKEYACKNSWSLSRLTHSEISWKNSRIGIGQYEDSDNIIKTEDIQKDAIRYWARAKYLKDNGLLKEEA